jgi:hypothetical protein
MKKYESWDNVQFKRFNFNGIEYYTNKWSYYYKKTKNGTLRISQGDFIDKYLKAFPYKNNKGEIM